MVCSVGKAREVFYQIVGLTKRQQSLQCRMSVDAARPSPAGSGWWLRNGVRVHVRESWQLDGPVRVSARACRVSVGAVSVAHAYTRRRLAAP